MPEMTGLTNIIDNTPLRASGIIYIINAHDKIISETYNREAFPASLND